MKEELEYQLGIMRDFLLSVLESIPKAASMAFKFLLGAVGALFLEILLKRWHTGTWELSPYTLPVTLGVFGISFAIYLVGEFPHKFRPKRATANRNTWRDVKIISYVFSKSKSDLIDGVGLDIACDKDIMSVVGEIIELDPKGRQKFPKTLPLHHKNSAYPDGIILWGGKKVTKAVPRKVIIAYYENKRAWFYTGENKKSCIPIKQGKYRVVVGVNGDVDGKPLNPYKFSGILTFNEKGLSLKQVS